MDLLFVRFTIFPSRPSVAGGVCRPRSEAPCIHYSCSCSSTSRLQQQRCNLNIRCPSCPPSVTRHSSTMPLLLCVLLCMFFCSLERASSLILKYFQYSNFFNRLNRATYNPNRTASQKMWHVWWVNTSGILVRIYRAEHTRARLFG